MVWLLGIEESAPAADLTPRPHLRFQSEPLRRHSPHSVTPTADTASNEVVSRETPAPVHP